MSKKEISPMSVSQSDGCPKPEYENEYEKVIPKFKIIASHCFILIVIIIFKTAYGHDIGFTTIIISELYKSDAEIYVSRDQLTWLSSHFFMKPVGALVGGFLTQLLGCRMLIIICGILYITSSLMFHLSINAAMLLTAQAISGLAGGMQKGPGYTYLAEISLPRYRGVLMACIATSTTFGSMTATTLGTYLTWRTLALINLAFPVIGLVAICFIPESPYWLASKNRYEDALRSLAWFRGWTNPDYVKDEMRAILNSSDNSTAFENITMNSTSSTGRVKRLKETSKQFFNRSFYIPLVTMIFMFAINSFSGTSCFSIFSIVIFEMIDSPIEAHTSAIALLVSRTLGGIVSVYVIKLAGKRKLLLITLLCCAICLTLTAVLVYFTSILDLEVAYRWVSMIAIIVIEILNTFGINKIAFLLNSELFPLHLRHIGVGVSHFINTIFDSTMNKMFLYITEGITISGAFIIFAAVNIVGLVGTYLILPETEGKSLKEIEEHYTHGKSLRKIK